MPDVFFRFGEVKQGWAGVPASASLRAGAGDLSKLSVPAYFWGVKLKFVIVIFFGHVQLLRFVLVKNFQSFSCQNSVIFIQSCEQASIFPKKNLTFLCDRKWDWMKRKKL